MKQIILYGDTGFAAMVAEYIHTNSPDRVVAFTLDEEYRKDRETFQNRPLIAFDRIMALYPPESHEMLITLSAAVKRKHYNAFIIEKARQMGFRLYSFVHSTAFVASSAKLGENVLVFPHAIVEPGAIIHDGVFIRSGAYVSHETEIGAYSYVAPRAAFSGKVRTGPHCFFGTNSTMRDHITIGRDVVVGAGAVVLQDLKDETVLKAPTGITLDVDRFKLKL